MIDLSIYLVTDSGQLRAAGHDPVEAVCAAVDGGVTTVQVREKSAPARIILEYLETLSAKLPAETGLIVNDRVDVFLAARARGVRVDGVHIGQRDLDALVVRELVGPDAVIGLSAGLPEYLAAAHANPGRVDYVGIGPVHATTSKADAAAPLGIERASELVGSATLPSVAIGGITPDDVPALAAAGADGVAVISWICGAAEPRAAAAALAEQWAAR